MPPIKAAQLDSPAKIPNPKNEINEDVELILKKPDITKRSRNKKKKKIPITKTKPNNVEFEEPEI